MKLRHVLIMGILVFLNGFVFTVLFLMVSREMARPAATPTPATTLEPTAQATSTPTETTPPTEVLPATNTPEAAPTNTLVVHPSTPTPTNTPLPPTSTPAPPTPTLTPGPATPTSVAPSPTPTPIPTATPTSTAVASYDFRYVEGSMLQEPNCAGPYFEGVVFGQGGVPTNGISVHFWFYDVHDCKVSGEGKPTGEWGFNPGLQEALKHTHIEFYLQVVNNCGDLGPRSDVLTVSFDEACDAGQFKNITFAYTG